MINVKDANGDWVVLGDDAFVELLKGGGKILGLSVDEVIDLKGAYEERDGKYPITPESLKEAFG